ncbi:hypothetical protein [Streptomyces geranii]|uniref:hypothetical protein n=1 Tax=Streptomyces geranii TaxID=2058923 RepID=UPI0018E4E2C5|nr:hypothetical protein [Streptomyces geranii]
MTDHDRALRLLGAMRPMTAVPVLGVPAVTVPVVVSYGLPLSVQLIGGRFADDRVLDAAAVVEERASVARPWRDEHPAVPPRSSR